jgi:hypothetical protein
VATRSMSTDGLKRTLIYDEHLKMGGDLVRPTPRGWI